MKAVRPSLKSSVPTASTMPSPDIFQPTSSGSSVASITTLRLSRTASGGVGADLLGQRDGRVERLARLGQLVDQAVVVGLLGGDGVAGEGQLHGDVARELAGEAEQAARRGDQVALDLGDAEHGGRRRHHQVAGQDDLGPAGQRGPVDGGDDRLGALALDDAGEAAPSVCSRRRCRR